MGRLVEEIMQREVVTVTPDLPVMDLLKRFVNEQISGVPVVTDDGEIVGVVSTTDVVRLAAGERELNAEPLSWDSFALPDEEYDADSAAPFFLADADWRYPSEGEPLPEGVFEGYQVSDIMTPAVFTVKPSDTVKEAGAFLLQGRIHRALVVEGEQLKGIVTALDLLRAFVEE